MWEWYMQFKKPWGPLEEALEVTLEVTDKPSFNSATPITTQALPWAFAVPGLRAQIIQENVRKAFAPGPQRAPLHLSRHEGEAAPTGQP